MGLISNLKNANRNARELEAEKAKNEQLKKNTAIVAGGGIAATAGVATYGFFRKRKYDKLFKEREADLESLDDKNQELNLTMHNLKNQVTQFEETVSNDVETINSLRDKLAETNKEMLNLQGATPDAALQQRVAALEAEKARLERELAQANNALAMASGNISQPVTTPTPAPVQQQTAPAVNYVNDTVSTALGVVSTVSSAPTSTPTAEPKGTAVPVIETTITTTEGTATTTAQGEIVLNNTTEQQCPVQPETPTAATTTATTSTTTSTTKTPTPVSQMPGKNGGKNKGKKR